MIYKYVVQSNYYFYAANKVDWNMFSRFLISIGVNIESIEGNGEKNFYNITYNREGKKLHQHKSMPYGGINTKFEAFKNLHSQKKYKNTFESKFGIGEPVFYLREFIREDKVSHVMLGAQTSAGALGETKYYLENYESKIDESKLFPTQEALLESLKQKK